MNNLLWYPGDGQPHGGVNGEGGDDPVSHRVRGVHCQDAGVAPSALAIMVRGGWWGVWGVWGGVAVGRMQHSMKEIPKQDQNARKVNNNNNNNKMCILQPQLIEDFQENIGFCRTLTTTTTPPPSSSSSPPPPSSPSSLPLPKPSSSKPSSSSSSSAQHHYHHR